MTKEERKQLCTNCRRKVNKSNAEYMKEYRAKLKAERESIKKTGIDV